MQVDEMYNCYTEASKKSAVVLKKLEDVRRRGRKRDMFG